MSWNNGMRCKSYYVLMGESNYVAYIRADFRFAPSQWETSLQSNAVSHWIGSNLESTLIMVPSDRIAKNKKGIWVSIFYPARLNGIKPGINTCRYSFLRDETTHSCPLTKANPPLKIVWRTTSDFFYVDVVISPCRNLNVVELISVKGFHIMGCFLWKIFNNDNTWVNVYLFLFQVSLIFVMVFVTVPVTPYQGKSCASTSQW